MAAHPPQAAPKLFREPAKTAPVQCPACGGPITLKGFGAIEQVSCPYCGSELSPSDHGTLNLLQQYQRARQTSALPLYARGTLEGAEWEIIGVVWRQTIVDGICYPWQEFLLYNPYKGYRWLIYQMTDGHWTIGGALLGAPRALGSMHKSVSFKKDTYKHFQTSVAQVTYVEGEFPWQVRMGDHAVAHDYVKGTVGVSIEEQSTEEGGSDVNFTQMRHIEGDEVWKAFSAPDSPPPTAGVGMLAPNPYTQGGKVLWISFGVLLLLWLGASVLYAGGRSNKVVFTKSDLTMQPFAQEVTIGEKGKKTTLELDFSARPLSNAWAYADVMLITPTSEEAVGMGATVEEWHGVSGGESWREGKQRVKVTVGGVEGGTYLLQIVPQAGAEAGKPAPKDLKFSVSLREDVVLTRYILIPLLFILAFPFINFVLGRIFEGRRWANSDYAPSSD